MVHMAVNKNNPNVIVLTITLIETYRNKMLITF